MGIAPSASHFTTENGVCYMVFGVKAVSIGGCRLSRMLPVKAWAGRQLLSQVGAALQGIGCMGVNISIYEYMSIMLHTISEHVMLLHPILTCGGPRMLT